MDWITATNEDGHEIRGVQRDGTFWEVIVGKAPYADHRVTLHPWRSLAEAQQFMAKEQLPLLRKFYAANDPTGLARLPADGCSRSEVYWKAMGTCPVFWEPDGSWPAPTTWEGWQALVEAYIVEHESFGK